MKIIRKERRVVALEQLYAFFILPFQRFILYLLKPK